MAAHGLVRPPALDTPRDLRALAVHAAYVTEAIQATDPPGQIAAYDADRLPTECVRTGRPILISHIDDAALAASPATTAPPRCWPAPACIPACCSRSPPAVRSSASSG